MADWSELHAERGLKGYRYVRVGFQANSLKQAIRKKLKEPCIALTKDKQLAYQLAREYGIVSTPYVPRSKRPEKYHHLQTFSVRDGRVTWSRLDSDGDEIADILNTGPIRGSFRTRRPKGDNNAGRYDTTIAHSPRAGWSTAVRDIKSAWQRYISRVTPIIKSKMKEKSK